MKLLEKFIVLLEVPEGHKDPEGLVRLRIKKLGYGLACSRCNGSGYFASYGTCFKCGGHGNGSYRLTKALYEDVKEAVEAGKLKQYLEDVKVQQTLKRADKELFNLMNNNELARDYSTHYKKERFNMNNFLCDLRFKQCRIYEKYQKKEAERRKLYISDRRGGYKFGTDEQRREIDIQLKDYYDLTKKELIEVLDQWVSLKNMILSGYFNSEE